MYTFEQSLHAIAAYPVTSAEHWYHYCNLVAAVASNEVIDDTQYSATARVRQDPSRMIQAVTSLRNSGYAVLQNTNIKRLTAPPNHFSSLISVLKIYGAPLTAQAVKGTAHLFWIQIESVAAQEEQKTQAAATPTPVVPETKHITQDISIDLEEASRDKMSRKPNILKKPAVLGLGLTSILGVLWYLNRE